MNIFTDEGLGIVLTIIVFGIALGMVLGFTPRLVDMMIGVAEMSVI